MTEQSMLDLCDKFRNDEEKSLCREKVAEYANEAKFLLQHTPKEMCQQLGLCLPESAYLRQLMGNRKNVDDIEKMRDRMLASYEKEISSLLATRTNTLKGCETCIMVLQQIQQLIKMPQVQNAIDKAVELTCRKIAGDKVDDCIEESKAYVHEALKFVQEQEPRVICTVIGECQSVKSKLFNRVTESVICDECKRAVDRVKAKLEDKDVRNQLELLITQVCNQFPDDAIREQCHRYTSQIIENAIDQLESNSSSEICHALHVC